ncbi:MAG: hypothetical protein ABII01_06615 [Candidatus Woesearchaeota archaeon]
MNKKLLIGFVFLIALVISGTVYSTYINRSGKTLLFFLNPEQGLGLFDSIRVDPSTNMVYFEKQLKEQPSPYDWIKEEQIEVYPDKIIIHLENPEWATFSNTNSMDPVIDYGTHAIEIVPESRFDIHVGDIASYENQDNDIIIHRVVEIGEDDSGWFAIMKGDNSNIEDPEKVRFEQIKRVLVMIIY